MSAPLIVYGHYVSQPSRSVLWMLSSRKVPFKFVKVDPRSGEGSRAPAYVAKFPSMLIPAIEHGDLKLSEHGAILCYLAEVNGMEDLYPTKDVARRAKIHEYLNWHHHNTRLITQFYFRPAMLGRLMGKQIPVSDKEKKRAHRAIEQIEKRLTKHDYIVDNQLSVADFSAYCEFDQLVVCDMMDVESQYKNVWEWMLRMRKVPQHDDVLKSLHKFAGLLKEAKL